MTNTQLAPAYGGQPIRILGVKRISRDTEDSSSLELQDYEIRADTERHPDHVLVDMVEDATVSGSVNLLDRKSFGKWFQAPMVHQWDAYKVTTQDRIVRDDILWWAHIGWCLKNGKRIIILDDPAFDITTEEGRMIAGVKASMAAKYRKVIVDKRLKQMAYHREHQYWSGGTWPYGYRAERVDVPDSDRKRYRLIIDPITVIKVWEAYDRLVNRNHSMRQIILDWNEQMIPTALDHQRQINIENGREGVSTKIRGSKWEVTTLQKVLSKPALMGYAVHDNKIMLKDGMPVTWAEPVFSPEEFDMLQKALARQSKKSGTKTQYRVGANHMLGVHHCMCGQRMYRTTNKGDGKYGEWNYYYCRTRPKNPCEWVTSWDVGTLDGFLAEEFLREVGPVPVVARKYIAGSNHTGRIQELRAAIDNLTDAIAESTNATVLAALTRKAEAHAESLKVLEAQPVIDGTWQETPTGQTYAELWATLDWKERGNLLRNSGIRMYVGGKPKAPIIRLYVPEDIKRRASDAYGGSIDTAWLDDWHAQIEESRKP